MRKNSGFSLIELLLAIGMIAIIVSIGDPPPVLVPFFKLGTGAQIFSLM